MPDYKKVFALLALSLGAQSSLADKVFLEQENKYKPIIELSGTKSKKRNLGEVDLMLPMWQKENDLIMLDTKFKRDRKSFEYNLGLVYRHNFDDRWILGIYNYFDHRKTAHNLRANQWTFGAEFLSRYLDGRANFYIPENKKRTLHAKPIEFRREHTTIYAVSASKSQEHTLPGYDLELGTPLFGLLPKIDDKFGTKIYFAKYDFTRKGVTKNSGLRCRLEQRLFEDKLAETGFTITLNLGTHYTNKKKLDNFVGLSLRMPLSNYHPRRSKMQERMMDAVIRDVDIRTEKHISESKEDLFWNGKKVSQMYFVTDGDLPGGGGGDSYVGDGSPENPFSIEQYRALINRSQNPDFIIIPIGEFTTASFAEVTSHSTAVDHRIDDVILAANNGSTTFKIVNIPTLQVEEDREEAIIDMMYNYDDGLDAYVASNQDQAYHDNTKASGYGSECYSPKESYRNEPSPEESRGEPQGSPESVLVQSLMPEPQVQIPITTKQKRAAPSSPAARSSSRRVLLSGSRAKAPSSPPKPLGRLETTYDNQNIGNVARAEEKRRGLQPPIPRGAQENANPEVARSKGKMEKMYENQNGGSILDKFSAPRREPVQ